MLAKCWFNAVAKRVERRTGSRKVVVVIGGRVGRRADKAIFEVVGGDDYTTAVWEAPNELKRESSERASCS